MYLQLFEATILCQKDHVPFPSEKGKKSKRKKMSIY